MIETGATIIVLVCWPVYLALFLGRFGGEARRERRNPASVFGILLQASAVLLTWVWRRPLFSISAATPGVLRVAAPVTAVILAIGAVWFSRQALAALGKQWSLVAGVASGHRLVQDGPFAIVRHPLYVCFFGLTLATAIVWTKPVGLLPILVLFCAGVWIRVQTEEKILRETFGPEFDEYARRVPAYFPRLSDRRAR